MSLTGLAVYAASSFPTNGTQFVVPIGLVVVGSSIVLPGIGLALGGLLSDRNTDADADDLPLGTLRKK
jgi:hypothetical protein